MDRIHPKIKNASEVPGLNPNFMGSRSDYLLNDDQIIQRIESRVYAQPNTVAFTDPAASEPSTKFMVVSRTSVIDMSESYISLKATFNGAVPNDYIVPNQGNPLITSINVRLNNTEIFNAQNFELITGFMANYYGSYQSKSEIMGVISGTPALYANNYIDFPAAAQTFCTVGDIDANTNIQQSDSTKLARILRSRLVRKDIAQPHTRPVIQELRIYLTSIPVFNELMHSADFPLFTVDNLEINVRFAALQKCYTALTDVYASSTVTSLAANNVGVTCTYSDICLVLSQKIVSDAYRSTILMRMDEGIMITCLNVDYRSGVPDASNNLQISIVPNLSHVLSGFVFFTKRGDYSSATSFIEHTSTFFPFGSDNNSTNVFYIEQDAGITQVRFSAGGTLIPQYPISSTCQRVSNFYDALKAIGIEPTFANYDQAAFEKPVYGISMLKSASPKSLRLSGVNLSRGLSFEVTFSGGTAYTAARVANVQYNLMLAYIQVIDLFSNGPVISR